jgi:four helix bundle protein
MRENIIQEKTFKFLLKVIETYKFLSSQKQEYILSKQFLRSWTSIGANIEEAIGAQSNKDFLHKIAILYKEARETFYRIKLLFHWEYLGKQEYESLQTDIEEISKIIGKIQTTLKQNIQKDK